MRIGVPKETAGGERRVALVPDIVRKLMAQGHEVVLEPGAGVQAGISDGLFEQAGATLGGDVWAADVVAKWRRRALTRCGRSTRTWCSSASSPR